MAGSSPTMPLSRISTLKACGYAICTMSYPTFESEPRELLGVFIYEPDVKVSLDNHDEKRIFNEAWDCLNGRFMHLRQLCGGLAIIRRPLRATVRLLIGRNMTPTAARQVCPLQALTSNIIKWKVDIYIFFFKKKQFSLTRAFSPFTHGTAIGHQQCSPKTKWVSFIQSY